MVVKQVRKIVFISSGGTVYGNPTYLPIDENHPTEPRVSYGITKLAIEGSVRKTVSKHPRQDAEEDMRYEATNGNNQD